MNCLSSKTEVMFPRTTIKWKTDQLNIVLCSKLFSKSKNSLKKISRKTKESFQKMYSL